MRPPATGRGSLSRHLTERYRLGRVLQATSSSTVYTARSHDTKLPVVVKVIACETRPGEEVWQTGFEPAISAVRLLGLTTFPQIIEAGRTSGAEGYIVMRPVEGLRLDLAQELEPGRLVVVLARLATSLRALHRAGGAHLNIAPGNVLLVSRGGAASGVFLGLGTGWLRRSGVDPDYAAPELAGGGELVDPRRCDVFSFARLLCRMLSIAPPAGAVWTSAAGLPDSIAELLEERATFEALLRSSLAHSPGDRPDSIAGIAEALRKAAAAAENGGRSEESVTEEPAASSGPSQGADPDDTAKVRVTAVVKPPDGRSLPGAAWPGAGALDDTVHIDAPSLRVALERHRRSGEERGTDRPPRRSAAMGAGAGTAEGGELDRTLHVSLPTTPGTARSDRDAEAPPPPAASASAPPPTIRLRPPAPVGWADRKRRPALWAAASASALGLAIVLFLLLGTGRDGSRPDAAGSASPTARSAAPTASAPNPTPDLLRDAEDAFAGGEFDRAERMLDAITSGRSGDLDRYDQERVVALHRSLAERRQWDRVRELDRALAAGDLGGLRTAVGAFAGGQPAAADNSVEVQRKLALARGLVDRYDRLTVAARRGRWADVIEEAAALLRSLPGCTEVAKARERAATEIEIEADALARNGSAAAAIEQIEPLRRWWPDRSELATRLASYEQRREEHDLVAEAMHRAEQEQRDGHPEAGLEVLADLTPASGQEAGVTALRARLRSDLERADAGTPVVTLEPGAPQEYEKDRPIQILLRVEDDYRVSAVTLYGRGEGSKSYAAFAAVGSDRTVYTVRIPPSFHRNGTVQYYVVATDPSGHRGELGTAARPLEIKRKRWSLFHRSEQ